MCIGHSVRFYSTPFVFLTDAFSKWMKTQSQTPKEVRDPVADALVAALDQFKDDKTFRLGAKGYVVRRAKGKGASGFIARKIV